MLPWVAGESFHCRGKFAGPPIWKPDWSGGKQSGEAQEVPRQFEGGGAPQ